MRASAFSVRPVAGNCYTAFCRPIKRSGKSELFACLEVLFCDNSTPGFCGFLVEVFIKMTIFLIKAALFLFVLFLLSITALRYAISFITWIQIIVLELLPIDTLSQTFWKGWTLVSQDNPYTMDLQKFNLEKIFWSNWSRFWINILCVIFVSTVLYTFWFY